MDHGEIPKPLESIGDRLYYYDAVEVYFDRDGVADWCCLEKYEEDADGS